jgi:hypothetical protein
MSATRTHCNDVTVTVLPGTDGSFDIRRQGPHDGTADSVSSRSGITSWVEALDQADEWAHPDCDGKQCGAWMPTPDVISASASGI